MDKRNLNNLLLYVAKNKNATLVDIMNHFVIKKESAISLLLSFIDKNLHFVGNPFHNKTIVLDKDGIYKIKRFLEQAKIKINSKEYNVKKEDIVIILVNVLDEYITPPKSKKENFDNIEKLIVKFVFEEQKISILKAIIDKYASEIRSYFKNKENINFILEKFIDEVKEEKEENNLLTSIMNMNYIFTNEIFSDKIKNEIAHSINSSLNKIKHSKISSKTKKNISYYLQILSKEFNKDTNTQKSDIYRKYNISNTFGDNIHEELSQVQVGDFKYVDMRDRKFITIDNSATSCVEDAIHISKSKNGNINLTIAITDPYSYIEKGGEIDMEAYNRTKTIYVLRNKTVITMFPEELYFNQFSLKENNNRYVVAHTFIFSPTFDLISFKSNRAIINVKKNIVFKEFDQSDSHFTELEYKLLDHLLDILKLEYPAVSRYYNAKGKIKGYGLESKSAELINYLKIFVNNKLIQEYNKYDLPGIYLVGDTDFNVSELILKTNNITDLLAIKDYFSVRYSTECLGFPGIGVAEYGRVTTPVRHYAALTMQELIKLALIDKKKYTDKEIYDLASWINEVVNHLNTKDLLIDGYLREAGKSKVLTK